MAFFTLKFLSTLQINDSLDKAEASLVIFSQLGAPLQEFGHMALFDYFSYDLQRHTNKTLKKTYIEVTFVGEVSELTGSNLHLHEVLLMPLIEPVLTIGETRLV